MTTTYNVSTLNATTIEAGTIWAQNIRYIGDINSSYSLNTLGDYVYRELNNDKFMNTITTYLNTQTYPNYTYLTKQTLAILPQSPDTPVNSSDLTTKGYVDAQVTDLRTKTNASFNASFSSITTTLTNLSSRVTSEVSQTNTVLANVSSRLSTGLTTLTDRITSDINGVNNTIGQIQTYQYRYYIIHWENMDKAHYWQHFLQVKR